MTSQLVARAAGSVSTERRTVRDAINMHSEEFKRALGDSMDVEHFIRGVFTTITANPELQNVTEESLMAGVLWAAQLRLEIGNGMNQFHLTPRKVSMPNGEGGYEKVQVCVPMIGYQGYIDLSYRHSKVLDFQSVRIREDDEFDYSYTTERGKSLTWKPQLPIDITKRYVGGIIRSKLAGGGVTETYMHISEIQARRPDYTKEQPGRGNKAAYTPKTPWSLSQSSFESMCDKTIIREHQKLMPKSIEMQRVLALDGRVLKTGEDNEIEAVLPFDKEFPGDEKVAQPADEKESEAK